MTHQLSYTNGRADFFELGEKVTAWHNEGVALSQGTPFADALAAGNLLYPVEKQIVYRRTEKGDILCETGAVTVRTDKDIELGVVGADYSVIQNADAFAVIEPLLQEGSLRLECGGVLRDGADAWVLAQISLGIFPAEIQEQLLASSIGKYLLVRTNHTGRANCSVTETDIRVVCANTLGLVESGNFKSQASVQHRGDATGRVKTSLELVVGGIVERTADFLARYNALKAITLDEARWQTQVADVVQRDPRSFADFDAKSPQADATVARYEAKRNRIHALWTEGDGHTGDGSAWEAYNGVAQAVDHDTDIFGVRSSRVRQLVPGGRLYGIKDNVFKSLLQGTEVADPLFTDVE
jgi:phage/plasmid-like protein (TIGR03299 family)